MSGRFVRQSAFRHVFGTPAKKEETFNDLRPEFAGQTGHITANHKYFAIALGGGGGPVQILSLKGAGRQDRNPPKLAVHKGQVLDFEFNPFVSNMIATAAEDCYVKVSQFPEGGLVADINAALVTLEGHQKKAVECHFHPTSANVLASASHDNTLKIWDIEQQAEKINIATSDQPWSFDWNTNGSLLALATKDKNVSLLDPRAPAAATVVEAFGSTKQSGVRWMDNHNLFCAIGFTKNSMRHFGLWDPRNTAKPVSNVEIDQSPGVLIPYYDPDNSILYLGGKGDGGIKYFEIVPEGDEKAFFLSEYRTNVAQKGLGFVPKRACNTKICEVAIALRVMRDAVIPVSMTVPRKSDMFQADIFPNTRDTTVSTQSAADYFEGKNADVVMMSMNPKDRGEEVEVVQNFVAQKSAADLQRELDAANARIAELEAEVAKLKA